MAAAVIDAICRQTQGEIIGSGPVTAKTVTYTPEAFDIGTVTVGSDRDARTLHVMNEYMAVDTADGTRLAGYPDVITTLDENGVPVSVGEVTPGRVLRVLRVPKSRLPLSSSVTDPSVYPIAERALGINLTDYALG